MLKEELVKRLIELNYTIATVESITGGMIASEIVGVANASECLKMSFVTYSDLAKNKIVNVNMSTIEKYGVVSEEVAIEMVKGVALKAKSNVAISTTGFAGPTGGTIDKPVGSVCFGFYINGRTEAKTMFFGNIGRNEVRIKATEFAISYILNKLL